MIISPRKGVTSTLELYNKYRRYLLKIPHLGNLHRGKDFSTARDTPIFVAVVNNNSCIISLVELRYKDSTCKFRSALSLLFAMIQIFLLSSNPYEYNIKWEGVSVYICLSVPQWRKLYWTDWHEGSEEFSIRIWLTRRTLFVSVFYTLLWWRC